MSTQAKAHRLIMASQVDTVGDKPKTHVIISNHIHVFVTIFYAISKILHVIMLLPPFGHQPEQAANQKSCNLNGERLSTWV